MKRHGNLWANVIAFEALLRAADTARKGKRFWPAFTPKGFDLKAQGKRSAALGGRA